jgi:hypothetical protein
MKELVYGPSGEAGANAALHISPGPDAEKEGPT